MAQAGTMDLGRKAQAKPSGNPWPAVGLVIVVFAIVAAVWFVSGAGLVGGTLSAKPAAELNYDQIQAQRGDIAEMNAYFAGKADRSVDQIEAQRLRAATAQQLAAGQTVPAGPSTTSGTFHVGNPFVGDPIAPLRGLTTIDNPVKRDRVGGP